MPEPHPPLPAATVLEVGVTTAVREEDLDRAWDEKQAQYREYCQGAGFDNRVLLFGATGCIPARTIRELQPLVPPTKRKAMHRALTGISRALTRDMFALFHMRAGAARQQPRAARRRRAAS